ncbi:MAG: ribbon-helix-helix protein, CopG family [Hyphomicrobiales bacterium]|nr:ribbon-helix-helix protein, CopG family [Hyphomicrobiales bacterium]
MALNTYVPGDLVEALDRIKERRGVPGRAPLIEEALRLLIEKEMRA